MRTDGPNAGKGGIMKRGWKYGRNTNKEGDLRERESH